MNSFQKEEIRLRTEILELLAGIYRHSRLVPKIRKVKKTSKYQEATSLLREIEDEMRAKKHEAFRKKLRKKFKKKVKTIKRKKH
jgi:hypothetical protein